MSDWFGEGRGVLRVDWPPSRSPPSLPCRPALARSKSRSGAHPPGSWHGITRDKSLETFLMSVQVKSTRIRLLFQQGVSGSAAGRPASGGGTSPCRGDTPSWCRSSGLYTPSRTGGRRVWPSNACVPPSTACTVGFWKLLFPLYGSCGGTGRAAASTPSGHAASAGSRRAAGLRPAPGAAGTPAPAAGSWREPEGPRQAGGGHGAVRDPEDSHVLRGREALSSPRA